MQGDYHDNIKYRFTFKFDGQEMVTDNYDTIGDVLGILDTLENLLEAHYRSINKTDELLGSEIKLQIVLIEGHEVFVEYERLVSTYRKVPKEIYMEKLKEHLPSYINIGSVNIFDSPNGWERNV